MVMDISQAAKDMRLMERTRRVAALRDGVKQRAVRFPDKKKRANRDACRGKVDI